MRNCLSVLDVDLYEITMLQGYFQSGKIEQEVTFDLFFRRIPFNGGFCLVAGLEQVIDYLINLQFTEEGIDYLRSLGIFINDFLKYLLKEWRFRCDVAAIPEGTIVFPNEPLIRVSAPIISAQLVETAFLNAINYQTLVATKAARLCIAANGDPVFDFGIRRAPTFAGVAAARAAYIGGVIGTSNVKAAKELGISPKGTMAHSWVQSFSNEFESFAAYAKSFPTSCLLLVDTYETLKSGLPNAIRVAKEVLSNPEIFLGIRIDSGDLTYMSREARKMLDEVGLTKAKIVASNELDEFIIADLKRQGAQVDIWTVGTKLVHPTETLCGIYKLVAAEMDGKIVPVIKISSNVEKTTIPGIKEVYRAYDEQGLMLADVLTSADEEILNQTDIKIRHPNIHYKVDELKGFSRIERLLVPIFDRHRCLIYHPPELTAIRERAQRELASLPPEYKRFVNPHIYRLGLTTNLFSLREKLIQKKLKNREV